MKIGIATDILRNKKTGVEQYTQELVRNLVREFPAEDFQVIRSRGIHDQLSGIKVFETPRRPKFFGSRFFYSLLASPDFFKDFDLVHCPTHEAPFFRKLRRTRTVMTIHDLTPLVRPREQKANRVFYFKYFLRPLLNNIDRIIADSFSTRKDLMNFFGLPESKISVVHLGVAGRYRPQAPDPAVLKRYGLEPGYIFFMGTVEPRKNIGRLLTALEQIKSKFPVKLVVAGGPGWKYKKILENIQKDRDVIFLGYVPDEDLVSLYNAAEIFVYPSLYEGFGLPVLEAMACGRPVITSNISSLPEITGAAARLINPLETGQLVRALADLLASRDLRQELGRKARIRSEQFSWALTARATNKIYREVLAA